MEFEGSKELTHPEVHVAAPADTCRLWNSTRNAATPFGDSFSAVQGAVPADGATDATTAPLDAQTTTPSVVGEDAGRYPDDIFENLIFRYEEPNGMSRWDSPLFTVPYMDDTPDLEAIWDAMVGKGVKVKANQATVLVRLLTAVYGRWTNRGTTETCR